MSREDQPPAPSESGQLLIYQDGATRLQVRLEGETVWLSQRLIAELYQVSVPTVNEHLASIYDEGELAPAATIRSFRMVRREGTRDVTRSIEHYSLEAILAVGYRVRSARGTAFRQWATARLGELLVKGFTLDDERLKQGRTLTADYFDELLERIRDIRASERMFYQKITDIYATSIDYDPAHPLSQTFFATVQSKLHWAIHGHTAAEILVERADAARPHMGLTTWKNAPAGPIRRPDVTVAKNYLGEAELRELNRVVTMYLDFAEDQARRQRPMHMTEWVERLDAFLHFNERNVLTHAGSISHELAEQHALEEFEKHEAERRRLEATQPTSDFDRAVEAVKQLAVDADPKKPALKTPAKESPMSTAINPSAAFRTERVLAAAPSRVFAAFAQADQLAQWWGPAGFTNTFATFEFKPAGRWVFVMHGPDGADYPNESVFREIEPDARIVIEHTKGHWFRLTVTLSARGDRTHLTWLQEFASPEVATKLRHILVPANEQNLDRLEALLAGRSEAFRP